MPGDPVNGYSLKKTAEHSGLTGVGYGLAIKRLQQKGFVESAWEHDFNGERYPLVAISDKGWEWIDSNEGFFDLKKSGSEREVVDDIPF